MSIFSGSVSHYERNKILKWWKTFRFKTNKYYANEVRTFSSLINSEMRQWQSILKKKLSKNLPKQYIGKLRPRNANFPHKLSGKQRLSIKATATFKRSSKDNWTVTINMHTGTGYANYTNAGQPAPKSGQAGAWVGWLDDVTYGDGRDEVPSASEIINEAIDMRNMFNFKG